MFSKTTIIALLAGASFFHNASAFPIAPESLDPTQSTESLTIEKRDLSGVALCVAASTDLGGSLCIDNAPFDQPMIMKGKDGQRKEFNRIAFSQDLPSNLGAMFSKDGKQVGTLIPSDNTKAAKVVALPDDMHANQVSIVKMH